MKKRKSAPDDLRVVQQTKLIPPTKTRALVERNRLLTRAMEATRGRLLLVTAGAGYGKTSLLVQVHECLVHQQCRLSWISLDDADNDHVRFLCHLVEALQTESPTFGAAIAFALRSAAPMTAPALRSKLLNELAAIEQDRYLFFDDYHAIADPDVRETVTAILLAPLPRVHFLIATRHRNELPVSRLKALGQMEEIESAELAFSNREASQFIDNACSKQLDGNQLSRLYVRTEGWAASLQLAAIALNGAEDVARFLDAFSGETGTVGEFLGDEVLRRQPEALQQFLMETAILQRFNVSLARAVTGREDSRKLLEEAQSRNLFIFSLDDRQNWFRYHHLFADFLQRRLRDRQPGVAEVLHRRAAVWLMDNGFPMEAIDHAFLAADVEYAGQILDANCTRLFAAGQISTLQKQAGRLPRELHLRLPRLQLELTWDYELRWQFTAATRTLATVRAFLQSGHGASALSPREKTFLESKLAHREMMLALLTDRLPEALALAQQWTAKTPAEEPFMCASVGTTQMHVEREHHQCEGTPAVAESLYRLFVEGGAHYGTVFHDSACGLTFFMRGELSAAARVYERARQTAIALQGEDSPLAAMPASLLAELYYERGHLAGARDLLARHHLDTVDFGFADHAIARFVTCSRLEFADGRIDEAQQTLDAGVQLADQYALPRLHAHLLNESVRQLIAAGRGHHAAMLLEHPRYRGWFTALTPGAGSTTTRELLALAWSRVCIARGEQARALPLLRRWVAHARERRCVRSVVRTSALLAGLHVSRDETSAARRVLRAALQMNPRDVFVRSFVDEGLAVVAVLKDMLAGTPDPANDIAQCLHGILTVTGLAPSPDDMRQPPITGPSDMLTEREREIVILTARGMATSDIASALGLTGSTVKWYWQRIFSKLHVHRRFEAVKLARCRGWIP